MGRLVRRSLGRAVTAWAAVAMVGCGRVDLPLNDAATGLDGGDAGSAGSGGDDARVEADGPPVDAGDGPEVEFGSDANDGMASDGPPDAGGEDARDGAIDVPTPPPFPCAHRFRDDWDYYLDKDTSPWRIIRWHPGTAINVPGTSLLRLTNDDIIQRAPLDAGYFLEMDVVLEGSLALIVGFPGVDFYLPSIVRANDVIQLTGFRYASPYSAPIGLFQGQGFLPEPLHVTAFVKAGARQLALRVERPGGYVYRSGFVDAVNPPDAGAGLDVSTPQLIGASNLQADHPARLSSLVGCQGLSDAEVDVAYTR